MTSLAMMNLIICLNHGLETLLECLCLVAAFTYGEDTEIAGITHLF